MPATTTNLTTFSNIARSGSLANYDWISPSNAQTNNNTSALIDAVPDTLRTASGEGYIDFLQGKQLVTTVPTTASITGLAVRIRRDAGDSVWDGSSGVAVTDQIITLIHTAPDGITRVIGDNKSTGALWNTGTLQYYSVGGTNDTWNVGGLGLTAWLVNDSGFGISISPYVKYNIIGQQRVGDAEIVQFADPTPLAGLYGVNTKIDHVEISVFYLSSNITFDGGASIGITSAQVLPITHRLSAVNRIQHIGKTSDQVIGNHRLSYNTYSIRPSAVNTAQAISNINRLTATARINVSGKTSDQVVGNQRLNILPYRLLHSSVADVQSITNNNQLFAFAKILSQGINTLDSIGLQRLQAIASIRPNSLISAENFGLDRLFATAAIRPSAISSFDSFGNLRLIATANILAESLRSAQNTGQTRLTAIANIRPTSTPSAQTLGNNIVSNITGIRPSSLLSPQVVNTPSLTSRARVFTSSVFDNQPLSTAHYLYNYFYENLNNNSNSFYAGDFSSFFTWDNTYNLPYTAQNGKSIRRLTVGEGSTPGNRVAVYPAGFYRGPSFYYSGYIKINTSGGLSGLGFGIDTNTSSNGYFVLLSANNTAGSPSVQIRRNVNGSTIASYNQTGLINTSDWYRIIITWSSTGLITANVYNSLGSTLIASVSVTDTTYTYGFIGVSAFDDSAFDNLTNIVAKFITEITGVVSAENVSQSHRLIIGAATINVVNRGISQPTFSGNHRLFGQYRIRHSSISDSQLLGSHTLAVSYKVYPSGVVTAQNIGNHRLVPGAANIFASSLQTAQIIGNHLLSATANIKPSGLLSTDALGTHTLSREAVRIFHSSILSAQNTGSHRLLLVGSEILAIGVQSAQNIGLHTLVPGKVNILHGSLTTAQNLGLNRLSAINLIYPNSITTGQIIGSHLIRSIANILPSGINSVETIGLHRLIFGGVNLYPSGQTTAQVIGSHRLAARNFIYSGSINSDLNIGSHRLNATYRINPSAITTIQTIGLHRLTPGNTNIYHSSIVTAQQIGLHRLFTGTNIRPSGLDSSNLIANLHRLQLPAYGIRPSGLTTSQTLGLHRLSAISFIYPSATNSSTLIANLHRLAARNYIYPDGTPTGQIIGSHLLNTGSSIRPSGLTNAETIGLHRLSTIWTINPSGQTTVQAIGLHRLSARAYIYPGGTTSDQIIGSHTLVTNAYISHLGTITDERIGLHRLSIIVLITPTNIDATVLPQLHRLVQPAYKIYPTGQTTEQNIGSHRLASLNYIRPQFLPSSEIIGSHRLAAGKVNIYHVSIVSDQTFGLHRLDASLKIRPTGIASDQNIGLHRLVYGAATIFASGLGTLEATGLHRLHARYWIYHTSPFDKIEVGWSDGAHGVYLSFDEFIYVNNHAPGQPGYYPMNAPVMGEIHRLNVENYNIFASSMPTEENPLGSHRLSYLASIKAITIASEETIGLHRLNAVAYIRPSAKTTEEALGLHRLHAKNYIYPPGQISRSFVGNNQVSAILSPLSGYNTGSEILLTENGTNLYTWSSAVFPQVEVILNSNILPASAYQLLPSSGKIIFNTINIASTDTLVVKLYTFILSDVPKLKFESFIYVWSIESRQRLGRHKLKLQSTPGFIDSYFELLQTIEVDIQ